MSTIDIRTGSSRAARAATWAIALAAVSASSAWALDVAAFLPRAEALKANGHMAIFSPDAGALMGEINAATKALRDERLAAKATGKPQAYCPPAQTKLNTDELLTDAQAVPVAQRPHTDLKEMLRGVYAKHYPCPA